MVGMSSGPIQLLAYVSLITRYINYRINRNVINTESWSWSYSHSNDKKQVWRAALLVSGRFGARPL